MPDALTMRRARSKGCRTSYFFLDTHIAQLVRADVRNDHIRSRQREEHEQADHSYDYGHLQLLSLSIIFNAISSKKLHPLTVL